jgi:tetratricopeptide (TPR) repeat protein
MVALVLLSFSAGLFLILHQRFEAKLKWVFAYLIPVLILLALAVQLTPKTLFTVAYSTTERDLELIDYREGVEGTVTVHLQQTPVEQKKRIDVDGLNVAGTSFMLRTLQTLQGHLPLIVHANAKKVLQIGFGTGQTSYSALLHPIEQFTLVEISENVLELSAIHFQEINKGVIEAPRFRSVILDGKNYVKYSGEKYDVIMNDANYAVATGSASLFTQDHFEYCKNRLKPGGLLSTWMTTDLDPQDFKIVLKTFQSVFPYSFLWMAPNCINKQVVLMGATEPLWFDFNKMQQLFENLQIKKEFGAINIGSTYDLLDCLVLDPEGISSIAGDVPLNRDNFPILEFSTRAIRSRDFCAYQNLAAMLIYPPNLKNLVKNFPEDIKDRKNAEENLKRHYTASRELLRGMMEFYQGKTAEAMETLLNGSRLIPESNLAAYYYTNMDMITWELNREMLKNPHNPEGQLKMARHQIGLKQYGAALELLYGIVRMSGNDPFVEYEIARCYLGQAEIDSAAYYLRKSLQKNDALSSAWYFLGQILYRQDQSEEALEAHRRAVSLEPRMYEAHNAIGAIYHEQKKYREALSTYQRSLSIMAFQPEIAADVGDCFLQLNKIPEAISMYQRALKTGNENPLLMFNLGNAFFFNKQYELAADLHQRAITLDSSNPEFYYNFGNALVMQGKLAAAADVFAQAVQLNPKEPDYYNNLGMCYRNLGDLQSAMQVFNQGLKAAAHSELLIQNAEATQKLLNVKPYLW